MLHADGSAGTQICTGLAGYRTQVSPRDTRKELQESQHLAGA